MTTATYANIRSASTSKLLVSGAIAGLGGGLVFGILMGMMSMLPMVGMLVGQENAVVGFFVHMVISAVIGASFGLTAGRFTASWGSAILLGSLYGIVWWVLGALILMPILLGMNEMIFALGQAQWMSLMGHILYGIVTAVLFVFTVKNVSTR